MNEKYERYQITFSAIVKAIFKHALGDEIAK